MKKRPAEYWRKYRQSKKGRQERKETTKRYNCSQKGKKIRTEYYRKRYTKKIKAQRESLYVKQNGCCAICGKSFPLNKLYYDHNHRTGKYREMLCSVCNPMTGFIETYPELVNLIVIYLQKHS